MWPLYSKRKGFCVCVVPTFKLGSFSKKKFIDGESDKKDGAETDKKGFGTLSWELLEEVSCCWSGVVSMRVIYLLVLSRWGFLIQKGYCSFRLLFFLNFLFKINY